MGVNRTLKVVRRELNLAQSIAAVEVRGDDRRQEERRSSAERRIPNLEAELASLLPQMDWTNRPPANTDWQVTVHRHSDDYVFNGSETDEPGARAELYGYQVNEDHDWLVLRHRGTVVEITTTVRFGASG